MLDKRGNDSAQSNFQSSNGNNAPRINLKVLELPNDDKNEDQL